MSNFKNPILISTTKIKSLLPYPISSWIHTPQGRHTRCNFNRKSQDSLKNNFRFAEVTG